MIIKIELTTKSLGDTIASIGQVDKYQKLTGHTVHFIINPNYIDLFETDGRYLAELARQEIIKRYGLKAYKNGWSVFTTINSKSQDSAQKHLKNQLSIFFCSFNLEDVGFNSFKYLVIPDPFNWKSPSVSPEANNSKVFLSSNGIFSISIYSMHFSIISDDKLFKLICCILFTSFNIL